ncbi:MAG: hypothetical protein CMN60_06195 [Sphingobium sp.]|nr:hypothetical protein [Sphingobium sp.]
MTAPHPNACLSKGNIMTSFFKPRRTLRAALMSCAAGGVLLASPALAQDDDASIDPRQLIEQMVAEKIITREQADRMIRNAKAATVQTQTQAQAQRPPLPQAGVAADGTQTVTYVSPVVREQIAQQVRAELGTQAQAEGWSKPGETPEWTRRISLYGDVRARYEGIFMDGSNSDAFGDYGAINQGEPFDINDVSPGFLGWPYLNAQKDRTRFQLRARLGLRAQITDWVSADVRIATGNDRTPVSTNQTMGAFGGGGYEIWLDRASIRLTPIKDAAIDIGRFSNPFWTSELMFDQDLNFDGIAVSGHGNVGDSVALFGTAGAFPIFNTDLNFGSRNSRNEGSAYDSQDKYLFAAQAGIEVKPSEQVGVRLAGGYFFYDNVAGKMANCYYYELTCASDAYRPAFQQYGNTMMVLRNNDFAGAPNPSVAPNLQYFGLASKFEVLNVHGAIDFKPSERFGVRLEGDFVKNLGWKRGRVAALAQNNFGEGIVVPAPTEDDPDATVTEYPYGGGDTGWQVRLAIGSALDAGQGNVTAARVGDWNAWLAYRRLESDAVMDAFADSDFGIGGTNVRGWQIGGSYAIAPNTLLGGRWMSAEEIVGPPFSVDRLFIDMSVRF